LRYCTLQSKQNSKLVTLLHEHEGMILENNNGELGLCQTATWPPSTWGLEKVISVILADLVNANSNTWLRFKYVEAYLPRNGTCRAHIRKV
jgi:hypothetical protein